MNTAALVAALAAFAPAVSVTAPAVPHPELSSLPLNQIQVIGTHNSYKLPIQPELYEQLLRRTPTVASLDYSHRPLPEQLDIGLCNLELDLYYDPAGNHYANPLGNRLLTSLNIQPIPHGRDGELAHPGLKVMHDCDFDFRSHTLRFEDTLAGLRYWSATHPGHMPIFITLNLKAGGPSFPGGIDPVEWDDAGLTRLESDLTSHLGPENLVMPDEIRAGEASLMAAIGSRGWPTVDACRGRFFFIIDEGGDLADAYLALRPNLAGAAMFTAWPEEAETTAFRIMNEPRGDGGEAIRRMVATGRIVRTRADAETAEMRTGDLSRFEAAKASGAQIITTDYPYADERHNPEYKITFEDGGVARDKGKSAHEAAETPGTME